MAASPPMAAEHGQALTAEILLCCDRVIAAISRGAASNKRKLTDRAAATCPDELPLIPSKKRARRAEAHREVQSGTTADGFLWRKYGQKDINGSKHPRFYYRCAYSGEGCGATRRVQQSQEDPAAFVIAYYGEHTCGSGAADACQQGGREAMPPAVVDSGSNAGGNVGVIDRYQNVESPQSFLAAEQSWRRHGDAPGETSSSSSSSEAELGTSPVLEFLEGSLGVGWECVVNYLGFSDLPQTAMLQ